MKSPFVLSLFLTCCLLSGCTHDKAQIAEQNLPPDPLPQFHGNAGCIVKKDNLLLAILHGKTKKWDIPAGKPDHGELAHQTAERETFEETGLKVKAKRLIYIDPEPFYIYECKLVDENLDISKPLPVPASTQGEIDQARFIDVDQLNQKNTRYPDFLDTFLGLFKKLP